MRNLDVRIHTGQSTGIPDGITSAWQHCTDTDTTFLYNDGRIFKLRGGEESEILVNLQAEGVVEDDARCIGMASLPDIQSVLVGLSTGQLVQVGADALGMVEEVGCVECGLECLVMSPDLEIITLVTSELVAITMTRDYVPVMETKLLQDKFGEGEFVNVGWGKKETQFHGKAGKESRVVAVESGKIMEGDDGTVRVSWRGDGQMFCVSYVMPGGEWGDSRRKLRVLDRSGSLYSTSEECPGLEWGLAWKPSGSLIATTVTKHGKHTVAFFEKNGLQHGEFVLGEGMIVSGLAWSCDSEVLALWGKSVLQLWVRGNYHWYCKQEIDVEGDLVEPSWSGEDPTLIRFIVRKDLVEELRTVRLDWLTAVSGGVNDRDLAMCGVVDGCKVLVTPFRQLVVPPPSSAFEVHLPDQVQQVVFPWAGGGVEMVGIEESLLDKAGKKSNNMICVTKEMVVLLTIEADDIGDDGCVKITGAGGAGFKTMASKYNRSVILKCSTGLGTVSNLVWVGGYLIGSVAIPDPALLVYKDVQGELVLTHTVPCASQIYLLAPKGGGALIQLCDGHVLNLVLERDQPILEPTDVKFPALCSKVLWTQFGVLGLTKRYRLYLNNQELASNITSMALHTHFLLATTLDHRLVSMPLAELESKQCAWSSASSRRVERGSRLVCAVSKDSRTVLQMPRGNLEVIQPRSLSIIMVADLLDERRYHDAFLLARRQRMNLNLLVDHSMSNFLDNCDKFVAQISPNSDHLNIFLADLVEEDVCSTMYSAQYTDRKVSPQSGKVSRVCSSIRKELIKQDSTDHHVNNLLPILGTLVRDGGQLEEALKMIKHIQEAGLKVEVDNALRFLTYMVDVNALFDVALGTYDFDLVLMVAEKSQKDPKEYIPFLNNFKQMEENFMKYSIDKYLKRFESALHHIAKCQDKFEACIELVKEFRLFKPAMDLFPLGSDNYKQVCQSYASYLETKRYYEDASILYERAGKLDQAVTQAELGLSWQRAGYLARKAKWSADRLVELYRNLATKLENNGLAVESAVVCKEWLQDPEEAVAVLTRCNKWQEVLRQARDGGREDLVETHIRPAARDRRKVLCENLLDLSKRMSAYVERLLLVRNSRNLSMQDDGHDLVEDERNVDDADLFSDTTSVGGASTVKSRSTLQTRNTSRSKSSKNRRKADRKLYSTKEGSMYEDIGIMAAVHDLVTGIPGVKDEIKFLLRCMCEIGELEYLGNLQETMQGLLDQVEEALPKVWVPDVVGAEGSDRFGPEATVEDIVRGGVAKTEYTSPVHLLPPHLRFPPQIKKDQDWKLQFL